MSTVQGDVFARQKGNGALTTLLTTVLHPRVPLVIHDGTDRDVLIDLARQLAAAGGSLPPAAIDVEQMRQLIRAAAVDLPLVSYLDVGCGNGLVTLALGAALQILPARIHGTDIDGWQASGADATPDIDYFPARSNFPLQNVTVVTLRLVLHSARDPTALLRLIFETLEPGGVLLIEGHDATTDDVLDLIDLEYFFGLVARNELARYDDYEGDYHPMADWQGLLTAQGFELRATTAPVGVTRRYFTVAIKPSDVVSQPETTLPALEMRRGGGVRGGGGRGRGGARGGSGNNNRAIGSGRGVDPRGRGRGRGRF